MHDSTSKHTSPKWAWNLDTAASQSMRCTYTTSIAIFAVVPFQHILFNKLRIMTSTADKKSALVERLIDAKAASKLSFDEIAAALSITNAQTAQLFTNQAQLSARAAEILKGIVPGISSADLLEMQKVPMRSFDPDMMQVSIVNFIF